MNNLEMQNTATVLYIATHYTIISQLWYIITTLAIYIIRKQYLMLETERLPIIVSISVL